MFTTKAYTINLLISEISALSVAQVSSVSSLANAISPRAGVSSAKFSALNSFLSNQLSSVVSGSAAYSSFGKTAKTRVIRALRARKSIR
jgi:hypothetical protein